jgi:glyoxylase-like metal-dependent hydrolase (beta-lactamase superfamily II)
VSAAAGPSEADRWEVTAVRYATRTTTKADCYLGYDMYGEADAPLAMDYFFYIASNGARTVLIDTGFALASGSRRGRTCLVPPLEALARLGIVPASIPQVLITHFHYDHIGNVASFPGAELLVPRRELEFWTGPLAGRPHFAVHVEAPEIEHIADAARAGRVRRLDARETVTPGITTYHVGGHCPGQLIVVVDGVDGPIVLASDAVHYYEELELDRPFAVLTDLEEMYAAYALVRDLAAAPGARLLAGHDPGVLDRFPHVADDGGLLGIRVR